MNPKMAKVKELLNEICSNSENRLYGKYHNEKYSDPMEYILKEQEGMPYWVTTYALSVPVENKDEYSANFDKFIFDQIVMDFDSDEDRTPQEAIEEACEVAKDLQKRGLDVIVNTSGSKGAHLRILFNPMVLEHPAECNKHFQKKIEATLGVKLDANVYSSLNRMIRVPLSLHDKSNKYSHFIDFNDPLGIDRVNDLGDFRFDQAIEEVGSYYVPDIPDRDNNSSLLEENFLNLDKMVSGNLESSEEYLSEYEFEVDNDFTQKLRDLYWKGNMYNLGHALIFMLKKSSWSDEDILGLFKQLTPVDIYNDSPNWLKWINNMDKKDRRAGLQYFLDRVEESIRHHPVFEDSEKDAKVEEYQKYFSEKFSRVDTEEELYPRIKKILGSDKNPSAKLISQYITATKDLYFEYNTREYFERDLQGRFINIDINDVCKFFGERFNYANVDKSIIGNALQYVLTPVEYDFDLIYFDNGTYNSKTHNFEEGYYPEDKLPKFVFDGDYIYEPEEKWQETELYSAVESILKYEDWPWNAKQFYLCVGSAAQGTHIDDFMLTLLGKPNTGKSTLLNLIKRVFPTSNLKLQKIVQNDRFGLLTLIGASVNIDDDCSSLKLNDCGLLKSILSGQEMELEKKRSNVPVYLKNQNIPILFNAANTPPSINDPGMRRRNFVVKCENEVQAKNETNLRQDILGDKYKDQVSLFFSYCLNLYYQHCKVEGKPLRSKEAFKAQESEYEYKSYPEKMIALEHFVSLRKFAKELAKNPKLKGRPKPGKNKLEWVIEDNGVEHYYSVETYMTVTDVNDLFNEILWDLYLEDKISSDHSTATPNTIKGAMGIGGFEQDKIYIDSDQTRVYLNCIYRDKVEKILERTELDS